MNYPGPADSPALRVPAHVDVGTETCERLLAEHLRAVEQRFGAHGLGVIDLPSLGPEPLAQAQIRVGAVLLWCRELEQAGLLPLVEALAERTARGTLALPLGALIHRLLPFWRDDEHRFTAPERRSVYLQAFGSSAGDPGGSFDALLSGLVDSIVRIGRADRGLGLSRLQARLAQTARQLGRMVSERSVGIAAFAARDIVRQVREAAALLREPELVHALGGGAPATILARWAPRLLGRTASASRAIGRARAGAELLRWIADSASAIDSAAQAIGRDHPLVREAESWYLSSGALP